ncbi:MAG: ETX/MTX2 family pore-forming toxin [Bacteroides sp.]|nr:ETX/MTX2 family pore-forming toxin [Bacteroides sp.]
MFQIAKSTIPIQVYIKNNGKYLGVSQDKTTASLYNSDDYSGRQRWLVSMVYFTNWDRDREEEYMHYYYSFKAVGGTDGQNVYIGHYTTNTLPAKVPMGYDFIERFDFDKIDGTKFYYLSSYYPNSPNYLSHINNNIVRTSKGNGDQLWEVEPVDSYRLINLSWKLNPSDIITTLPDFIQETTVINNSSITQTMSATYTKSATETSTFSEIEGLTVNISTTAKVGVPFIADGKINTSTTTSSSWQYGGSDSQQDQRSYDFPLNVPPYTTVTSKVMVQMSKLTATYVATYRGETSGAILELEGKWEGVQTGNIYYEITEQGTGRILKTLTAIPEAPVILE